MTYLLDTNVISEARKPDGDAGVRSWLQSVPAGSLFLSVLVLGEIRRGIEQLRRRDRNQAGVYEAWLSRVVYDYGDRIIPITPDIADEWGRLNVPDPLPVVDGLIAATAKVRGLTLVTRNTRDFVRAQIRLLNPFSGTFS